MDCRVGHFPNSSAHATGAFVSGVKGTNVCPAGSGRISSAECQAAAAAGWGTWRGERTSSGRPKGCFSASNGKVYFNEHPSGSASSRYTPICRAGRPPLLGRSHHFGHVHVSSRHSTRTHVHEHAHMQVMRCTPVSYTHLTLPTILLV